MGGGVSTISGGRSEAYDAVVRSLYKIAKGEESVSSSGRKIEISEVLEVCKKLGVDINIINHKGESALIVAARKDN